jgi:hypothetical protein
MTFLLYRLASPSLDMWLQLRETQYKSSYTDLESDCLLELFVCGNLK